MHFPRLSGRCIKSSIRKTLPDFPKRIRKAFFYVSYFLCTMKPVACWLAMITISLTWTRRGWLKT